MHHDEIQSLKDNESKHTIINNSFFSASSNRVVALMFLNSQVQSTDVLQNVVFEIEINTDKESSPYANISHLSSMDSEDEVLFMIGTQFIRTDASYDTDINAWIIKLSLTNNVKKKDDKDFTDIPFKRRLLNCTTSIKNIDCQASFERDIQVIFDELIHLYPSEKWISAVHIASHGIYKSDRGQPKDLDVVSDYERALEIWHEHVNDGELNVYKQIAEIHSDLAGDCYEFDSKDNDLAKKHYDLAVNYYELALRKSLTNDETKEILHYLVVESDSRLDITQDAEEKIQIGRKTRQYHELKLQHLLSYHSQDDDVDVVRCFMRLAELQSKIHEYDDALLNYDKVLELYFKRKFFLHDNVTLIYRRMAMIYFKYKYDYHLALKYQLLAHKNISITSKLDIKDLDFVIDEKKKHSAESHLELAQIYIALHEYDVASEHLTTAVQINEERSSKYTLDISASYYENFADIYIALDQSELVMEHLRKALDLYRELKQQHIQEPQQFRHHECELEELIEHDEIKIRDIEKKLNDFHNYRHTEK